MRTSPPSERCLDGMVDAVLSQLLAAANLGASAPTGARGVRDRIPPRVRLGAPKRTKSCVTSMLNGL